MGSAVFSPMRISVQDAAYYLKQESRSKLLAKVRTAVIFSVLSTIMQKVNQLYRPMDIIAVTLSIHYISTVIHSIVLHSDDVRRRLHCGYILRSINRQSILVVSDVVAHNMYIQDFGTQQDNMLIFVITTTAFIAILTLLPAWFLYDEIQGSLKNILIYSFTSRYSQLHIQGLHGNTGLGTLIYGLLFVVFTIPKGKDTHMSLFMETLQHTITMIFSNLFLTNITPASSQQVFPIAIMLAMFIVSDHIPMSSAVSTFVLWRMSKLVSGWVSHLFDGTVVDQILFYSVLLCVLPIINHKVASVISVAALQTVVSNIMLFGNYLGSIGMVISSISILLVTDIALDKKKMNNAK